MLTFITTQIDMYKLARAPKGVGRNPYVTTEALIHHSIEETITDYEAYFYNEEYTPLDENVRYLLHTGEFKYDGEVCYALAVVDNKLLVEVGSDWFTSRRFLLTDYSKVSI